jgi:thioredoxin-related protein
MKKIFIFLFFALHFQATAQTLHRASFENLKDSLRKQAKPLLIFIHTDWCKYCKLQANTTFTDLLLIETLNQKYYCLSLNAEENKEIIFLNKTYKFKATGAGTGVHELAELLGTENGVLSYPTTVFLNSKFQIAGRMQGFQRVEQLLEMVGKVE